MAEGWGCQVVVCGSALWPCPQASDPVHPILSMFKGRGHSKEPFWPVYRLYRPSRQMKQNAWLQRPHALALTEHRLPSKA